jgi:transposase-like protein
VTIDKSGANLAGLNAINADREVPIKIRQSKYLDNVVEQDHRAIKRIVRSILNARIQELSLRSHHFRRYRTHAHDSERADEESQSTASFSRRAILRSQKISIPIRSVPLLPNFLTATEPAGDVPQLTKG